MNSSSGKSRTDSTRQFDAELVLHPGTGRADAVIGLEELAAGREIDLGDRRRGLLQEKRIELLAADLLQLAVADGQVPARVGELGQGLPVPVALVFGVGGQVLFQGVHDLPLGLPLGLVHGKALGILEIEAAEVAGVELHRQFLAGPLGEGLRAVIAGQELVQAAVDLLADHVQHELLAIGAFQDPLPIAVDPLPLLVHDLVVFQEVLAGLEVPLFDLLLGALDAARDHPAFDRFALLHAQPREPVLDPLAAELPHQVVFQREIETAAAGVALAAAAAAELEVDAAGLVPLAAQHVQAAHGGHFAALGLHLLALFDLVDQGVHFLGRHVQFRGIFRLELGPGHGLGIAAEDDVGAAAGHVRGDGHGPFAPGLGDDFGLALVMLGIQHLVRHAALFEHPRDHFAALDGDRAHQDRPAGPLDALGSAAGNRLLLAGLAVLELDRVVRLAEDLAQQLVAFFRDDDVPLVHPLDFVGDGLVLLPLAAVDHVRMVDPLHLAIGGHGDHVELVDLPELVGLGHGGAGHAADLLVELEEVLQRDRGQGLVFFLDADAFLGLDRLVQAVAPIAARHETAGELVDDDHLAFLVDDVVHVALVEVMGLQAVVDQVRPLHVAGRVEALHARQLLGRADALVGEVGRVLLLLDLEVRRPSSTAARCGWP